MRTHSSTANSSRVTSGSHCQALVRFSCVMLERLPRSSPSAALELADHCQVGAQHLVMHLSFRHGRAGAAPRQWRRSRELLYPGNLDMVMENKATIKLKKYRQEVHRNNRRQIVCRPAIASTSARIHCELLRLLLLHTQHEATRPVALLRSSMSECNQRLSARFAYRCAAAFLRTLKGRLSTLKSRTGLTVARAAALRININTDHHVILTMQR